MRMKKVQISSCARIHHVVCLSVNGFQLTELTKRFVWTIFAEIFILQLEGLTA